MSPAFRFTAVTSSLITGLTLWHFGTVLGFWGAAPQTQTGLFIRIGIFVGITVLGSIALAIFTALVSGTDEFEPDEREKLILRKTDLAGHLALASGVVVVIWFVFTPLTPMQTANALLGAIVFGEIAKLLAGAFYLVKGA